MKKQLEKELETGDSRQRISRMACCCSGGHGLVVWLIIIMMMILFKTKQGAKM